MIALYFTLCLPLPYTSHTVPYWNETKRTGKGHTLTWLPSQGIFPLDAFVRVSSIVYCLCVCYVLCCILMCRVLCCPCCVLCTVLYCILLWAVLYCTVLYRTLHCYSYNITLYHTVPCLLYRTYTTMLAPPFLLWHTYVFRWNLMR